MANQKINKLTETFKLNHFKNTSIDERNFYNVFRQENTEIDPGIKGIPYMFVTSPLINLSEANIEADSFFTYLYNYDPEILKSLSYIDSGNPFITLLSNRVSEYSITDLSMQTTEVGETHYGYQQNLPQYAPLADSTTVTYTDNANLDVLRLHKAWFDYITYVTRGVMKPSTTAVQNRYLDYTSAIYHIIVGMDGETIQYFDKLTGCFPTIVPYSEMSSKIGGNQELIEFAIEYSYSYREYLNPTLLVEFNEVSRNAPNVVNNNTEAQYRARNDRESKSVTILDPNNSDLSQIRRPFIVQDNGIYKLKFN